jgi:hypothetical protein
VKDADNNFVAGVSVTSTSQPSSQTPISGTTDSNGLISFSGILKGTYTIKASKTGYEDKTWTATVLTGQQTTETATLTKPSGIPWVSSLEAIAGVTVGIIVALKIKKKPSPNITIIF